jgi:hypothetical protein
MTSNDKHDMRQSTMRASRENPVISRVFPSGNRDFFPLTVIKRSTVALFLLVKENMNQAAGTQWQAGVMEFHG